MVKTHAKPVVGITPDIYLRETGPAYAPRVMPTWRLAETYARCVSAAGGVPIVLSPMADHAAEQMEMVDALVLTGGDDPIMEELGEATHPEAVPVVPQRQSFERAVLGWALADARDLPLLGVCLGMQYMTLAAGGTLDQHMPETTPSADDHWDRDHTVSGADDPWEFGDGVVHSKHRQAMADPGSLRVLARAHDGVIEAVGNPERRFWIGVQWHPERTAFTGLGQALFDRLVACARVDG